MSAERVDEVVASLHDSILPRLTPAERWTFEIRPAVTHGDIELFLNGMLWTFDLGHLEKVISTGNLSKHIDRALEFLRGRKTDFDHSLYKYDLFDVQKEVNYTLLSFLLSLIPDGREKYVEDELDRHLASVFGLKKPPKELSAAHYRVLSLKILDLLATMCREKAKK